MSARLKRSTASSCGTPWTTSRSTGSCLHASTTNAVPFFSRSDGACTTSGRSRDPARRGVRADDRRVELPPVLELVERLVADVVAEEVHDRLLPRRLQDRHVQRLGNERLAEVEVEEVGLRQVSRERAPLHDLLTEEALARQVEV